MNSQTNAKNREGDKGETLKIHTVRFVYFIFVRNYPLLPATGNSHWLNLMQAVNKLSSYVSYKSFVMFPTVMISLFFGVFSCKRITAQFLNFVPHGEKTLVEKILLHRGQRKVCFAEVLSTLVTFHLFLVLATNIFSEQPRSQVLFPTR